MTPNKSRGTGKDHIFRDIEDAASDRQIDGDSSFDAIEAAAADDSAERQKFEERDEAARQEYVRDAVRRAKEFKRRNSLESSK